MRLSVIIVSYNVYPFLDNCLRSVRQAMEGIDGEIIVVDNASVDGTPQLVRQHFPDVVLIANPDNRGFARANNQGINIAGGKYILLLNPDTVVSGDTLSTCVQFMDSHPDCGASGVRMIDGSGSYLPESKRGLPTLSASFMKMSGLYRLFPRSASWNKYYLGQIGEYETAPVDVLCGAFMFIRKEALDKAGLLDEDFFMYGEDIDLSYRITQAGYSIYYLPETSIIHYKGESTRKSSLNYILTFYQAMLIFTQKHPEFRGQKMLIRIAIYVHGLWQFFRQNAQRWWPLMMDALLIGLSFWGVSKGWALYYFQTADYFQPTFYYINLPLYILALVTAMFLNGAYDKPYSRRASWYGLFSGLILILVIYAILPTTLRSSRMVILMGSVLYAILMAMTRSGLKPWNDQQNQTDHLYDRRAIIIAGTEEAGRIKELINRSRDHIEIVGTVAPDPQNVEIPSGFLGHVGQLEDIIRIYEVREIIFSAQDVPFSLFTGSMTRMGSSLRYMLAASTTMNIVGSMSKDTEGESYAIQVHFNLSTSQARRTKRLFDILSACILLCSYPVLIFIVSAPLDFLKHIFQVLMGRQTWVSYHPADPLVRSLPKLPPGILHPAYPTDEADVARRLRHIHYVYARDYHWTTDMSILLAQLKKAGQTISGNGQ